MLKSDNTVFSPMMATRSGGPGVGIGTRISRGWRVTKLGFSVIRADPEIMVYMLFSGIMSMIAAIGLLVVTGGMGFFLENEESSLAVGLAGTFIGYMAVAVITVFWNAAIIASAHHRLTTGENPSFSYGINQAMKRLPQIIVWGLISGTVGILIRSIESLSESSNPAVAALGMVVSWILRAAWWITTFFVVPMIVLDNLGVGESMSKSPELFKETWGENVVSMVGTGLIGFLVTMLIVLVCLPLFALGDLGIGLGILVIFGGVILSTLFFSACESVNRASLYHFAKTGQAPPLAEKYGLGF